MALTASQLDQLHQALLKAFKRDDLRRLLLVRMEVDFDHVAAEKALSAQVWDLVRWADRQGRAVELAVRAADDKPANPALQALRTASAGWDPAPVGSPAGRRASLLLHRLRRKGGPALVVTLALMVSMIVMRADVQRLRYELDIARYERVIRIHAGNTGTWSDLGLAYYYVGEYGRAIAAFDTAITSYMEASGTTHFHVGLYLNRGNAYLRRGDLNHTVGDYDQAIHDYEKAIDVRQKDQGLETEESRMQTAFVHAGLGNAYLGKGEFDSAISEFQHAIDIDPSFASAIFQQGVAYWRNKACDVAESNFRRAAELFEKNGETGEYEVAKKRIDDLRNDPSCPNQQPP